MCLWVLLTLQHQLSGWHIRVVSPQTNEQRLPSPQMYTLTWRPFFMRKGFSLQTTRTFQNHSCPSPLILSPKVSPPSDRLRLQLPTRHAMDQLPQGPCVSMLSLCSLCTHGVNPHPLQPPRGHRDYTHAHCSWAKGLIYFPSWTTTWPAAKTKILLCVFFPRNDNYSTLNIFQTSTTKMEKAFEEIIY